MSMIGLGRRHVPDARDLNYRLEAPATSRMVRHWTSRGVMDQGATSQCVAYACVKWLTTSPVINKPVDPKGLYDEAQRLDAWQGEAYDGTSVRAGMKALKGRGLISEYRWATTAEDVISYVLASGPVVMGTTWTTGLSQPDRRGFISFDGENIGGHAWLIIGASRKLGAVRMVNSWGARWGDGGRAWVSFSDLERLIADYGEAAVATETKAA